MIKYLTLLFLLVILPYGPVLADAVAPVRRLDGVVSQHKGLIDNNYKDDFDVHFTIIRKDLQNKKQYGGNTANWIYPPGKTCDGLIEFPALEKFAVPPVGSVGNYVFHCADGFLSRGTLKVTMLPTDGAFSTIIEAEGESQSLFPYEEGDLRAEKKSMPLSTSFTLKIRK